MLDPTSQSAHLFYNPHGQLSAVTLPAKVGAPGIPVINPDALNQALAQGMSSQAAPVSIAYQASHWSPALH